MLASVWCKVFSLLYGFEVCKMSQHKWIVVVQVAIIASIVQCACALRVTSHNMQVRYARRYIHNDAIYTHMPLISVESTRQRRVATRLRHVYRCICNMPSLCAKSMQQA